MVETPLPYQQRVAALQSQLAPQTALLLSSPSAVRYYTGFISLVPSERDGIAIITPQRTFLIHSSFSPLPADVSWLNLRAGTSTQSLAKHLAELKRSKAFEQLVIDTDTLTVSEYQVLQELNLPATAMADSTVQTFLLNQRSLKDTTEVARIKHAASITKTAIAAAIAQLRPGVSELEVKRSVEHAMENAGASDMAFPSIIAFGANTALPHHQPSTTRLTEQSAVLIDVGARVDGYCSDMTRTIWFGDQPAADFLRIEQLVQDAYAAALATLQTQTKDNSDTRAGKILLKSVDQAARTLITDAGYGEQFNHTTGHGLGLDIHEHPSVSWKSEVAAQPGMIITVEPGIYLEGTYGYRYENTVLITESGAEELTR